MSSKYKHEICINFNSNNENLANEILSIILKELENENTNLKELRYRVDTSKTDLKAKGNELLNDLNINVKEVSSNEDILKSDNFSAILISHKKRL